MYIYICICILYIIYKQMYTNVYTIYIYIYIYIYIFRVGCDARIYQLEGYSPESCLSWLRSHKGCTKHDLFTLEYSKWVCREIDVM